MAVADQRGTTITTGDTVAVAIIEGNRPKLVVGVISGAVQNDRGKDYFAVIRPDARFNRDIARAEITYNATYPGGVCLTVVKSTP